MRAWRQALLERAWQALKASGRNAPPRGYVALRLRADNPDWSDEKCSQELVERLGEPLGIANFRQILSRARKQFADFIYQDVADTLDYPSPDQVEAELAEVGLLEYCRSAVKRRRDQQ